MGVVAGLFAVGVALLVFGRTRFQPGSSIPSMPDRAVLNGNWQFPYPVPSVVQPTYSGV